MLVLAAIGLGRWRFTRTLERQARLPIEDLGVVGIRRAVVTTVAMVLPGVEEELETSPARAFHLLFQASRVGLELAAKLGAETEAPRSEGFRFFVGRFRPDPDHRARGLRLALALRERIGALMEELDRPPPALAVVTGDSLSAPFPLLSLGLERASFGRGPATATRLAREALPGEVRVDGERAAVDRGFAFEEADGVRRLVEERTEDAAPRDASERPEPAGDPA